jgi:hypothetical protein
MYSASHPVQVIVTQTSIRAKKRILNEILQRISCKDTQLSYQAKISRLNTKKQLDQLAVEIITTKDQ